MTVPANPTYKVIYSTAAPDDQYSFDFPVYAAGDLRVVKTASDGTETDLTVDAAGGFTVTFNGDLPSAGYITYPFDVNGSALDDGESLTILRAMDYSQETDLSNSGSFRAQVLENALDKLTMLVLQLKEQISRVLIVPVSTPADVSMSLPAPSAGMAIAWNGDADGLENVDITTGLGVVENLDASFHVTDVFSGTGAQTAFTLSSAPGHTGAVDVFISGVRQSMSTYSVSSTTLTFTTAPASGTNNVAVRYRQYVNTTLAVPAATSVDTEHLAAEAVTFAKMDPTVASAIKACTAQTLSNTTTTTQHSFSTTINGITYTPRVIGFLLTCTTSDAATNGYALNDTVYLAQGFFKDGANSYGLVVHTVSSSGFVVRTCSSGIKIPHKTTGVISSVTAGNWTITPLIMGW